MMNIVTCEICKNKFIENSICPYCGSEVEINLNESTKWDILYSTTDMIDAINIKGLLEGSSIPVAILSQQDTTRMFTLGNLAVIKIMVPIPYYNEAKELIKLIISDNE